MNNQDLVVEYDRKERNLKLLNYLNERVVDIDKKYPELHVQEKASKAMDNIMDSYGTYEEVKAKLDKTLNKMVEMHLEKIKEKKNKDRQARNTFEEAVSSVKSFSKEQTFFGETYRYTLIHVFELFESICNNPEYDLNKQKEKFSQELPNLVNTDRQKIHSFLSLQLKKAIAKGEYMGRKEDPLLYVLHELFRGIASLNYDVVRNLYQEFRNDVEIVGVEHEGKMLATIRCDQPIYVTEDGEYKSNPELFNFSYLKKIYDFAKRYDKKIKIHTITMYNSIPENLEEIILKIDSSKRRKFLLDFIDDYVKRLADFIYTNHYKLEQIDALNEICNLDNEGDILRNDFWNKYIGNNPSNNDPYYIDILKIVRKYFKDTNLIYNENDEYLDFVSKRIVNIVNNIQSVEKRDNCHLLDGLGLQSHYSEFINYYGRELDVSDIYLPMARFVKLNIKLYRTEFDFKLMDENVSNNKYKILDVLYEVDKMAHVKGFIAWGNSDNLTWSFGDENAVSIVNASGKPKREYYQFLNMYGHKQNTSIDDNPEVLDIEDIAGNISSNENSNVIKYSTGNRGFVTSYFFVGLVVVLIIFTLFCFVLVMS